MRRHFRVQTFYHQSTPGAAIEADSYITGGADPLQGQKAETNGPFKSFALTYDGSAPGVDSPFTYSLFSMEDHSPQAAWRKRRHQQSIRASRASEGIFIGLGIESAPADTTPLLNAHVLAEYPATNYAGRRKRHILLAGLARDAVKGVDPNLLPATSYLGDTCQLLGEIQAHMLEATIDGGLSWSLWTAEEVRSFLNERLSRFLDETHLIEADRVIPTLAGTYMYDLPGDLIAIERIAYLEAGSYSILPRIEKFTLDNGQPGWETTTGTPLYYVEEPLDPLTIRVVPTPSVAGSILLRYVPQHSTVGAVCQPIEIPSMFVPAIKYGVMADMLSKEGEANDPLRADQFEHRFQEGIALASMLMGKV